MFNQKKCASSHHDPNSYPFPSSMYTLLCLCPLLYIPEEAMPAFVVDGVYFEVMPKVCVALNQNEKCKILFVELLITFPQHYHTAAWHRENS